MFDDLMPSLQLVCNEIISDWRVDHLCLSPGYTHDHDCMYINGTGTNTYEFYIQLNRYDGKLEKEKLIPIRD